MVSFAPIAVFPAAEIEMRGTTHASHPAGGTIRVKQ